MASHGGIPSHMILNPEPNLRPLSITSRRRNDDGHPALSPHSAILKPNIVTHHLQSHIGTGHLASDNSGVYDCPVRSKQRSNNPEDPQPKEKTTFGRKSGPLDVNPSRFPADHCRGSLWLQFRRFNECEEEATSAAHTLMLLQQPMPIL